MGIEHIYIYATITAILSVHAWKKFNSVYLFLHGLSKYKKYPINMGRMLPEYPLDVT